GVALLLLVQGLYQRGPRNAVEIGITGKGHAQGHRQRHDQLDGGGCAHRASSASAGTWTMGTCATDSVLAGLVAARVLGGSSMGWRLVVVSSSLRASPTSAPGVSTE